MIILRSSVRIFCHRFLCFLSLRSMSILRRFRSNILQQFPDVVSFARCLSFQVSLEYFATVYRAFCLFAHCIYLLEFPLYILQRFPKVFSVSFVVYPSKFPSNILRPFPEVPSTSVSVISVYYFVSWFLIYFGNISIRHSCFFLVFNKSYYRMNVCSLILIYSNDTGLQI